MDLDFYRTKFNQLQGQRQGAVFQLQRVRKAADENSVLLQRVEEAREIIQTIAKITQEQLEYQISELGTLALETVFDDPYALQLHFELKRGRSEAVLEFVRNELSLSPLESTGGGAADVASFALRISLWTLIEKGVRPVFFLDEPFKNINDPSRGMHKKAAEVVKMVCDKLGLQILMVTLLPELIEKADKTFHVSKVDGVSKVREM